MSEWPEVTVVGGYRKSKRYNLDCKIDEQAAEGLSCEVTLIVNLPLNRVSKFQIFLLS